MTKTRLTRLQEFTLFGVFLTVPLFRLGQLGTPALTPAKILVGITFLLWMANILINKDSKTIITLVREKANILVLLFFALIFISLINTRYFQDENVSEIFMRIKMLILYFLIIGIIRDRRTFKIALFAFIVGSILTTGVGLYELTTGKAFLKEATRFGVVAQKKVEGLAETVYGGAKRVQGLYGDSGMHAHAMVIFFGLALPWLFHGTSRKIKILVGILLSCYVMNIISTGARFGWMSLGCALFIFLVLFKHRYKYPICAISIILVIVFFLALSLIPHLPTLTRLRLTGDLGFNWRLETYRQALEMVRDHPLLGVGTGNYLIEYHNYLSVTPGLSRYLMGYIHNSYLQIWTENGTIGFLVFLFFLLTIFLGLLAAYLKSVDLEMKALTLGLLTAFTGYAVEFSGVPVINEEPGWMIWGLGVALIIISRKEREESLTSR